MNPCIGRRTGPLQENEVRIFGRYASTVVLKETTWPCTDGLMHNIIRYICHIWHLQRRDLDVTAWLNRQSHPCWSSETRSFQMSVDQLLLSHLYGTRSERQLRKVCQRNIAQRRPLHNQNTIIVIAVIKGVEHTLTCRKHVHLAVP